MVSYTVFTKLLTICQKKKIGLNVVCKACVYANESTYAYVLLITLTLCFCKEFKQFDSYTTPNPPPPLPQKTKFYSTEFFGHSFN